MGRFTSRKVSNHSGRTLAARRHAALKTGSSECPPEALSRGRPKTSRRQLRRVIDKREARAHPQL